MKVLSVNRKEGKALACSKKIFNVFIWRIDEIKKSFSKHVTLGY